MDNRAALRIGDACTKVGSGATPRGGKDSYKGGATALVRSQNIHNDGFRRDGLVFIDDKQAAELAGVALLEGDVLLNITGDSVARCAQVDPAVLPARVNQHVLIIRPSSDKLDPRFLRYVLVTPSMQAHLFALASAGATRNALTKVMIEDLVVEAPPLDEQRAIAHILGTLDDKVELNRRMNETLEEMARALFKSWFVDFDPVRRKAEGRDPGLPKHLADLFPSRFVDSELGAIPEGWRVRPLGDVVEELEIGGRPKGGVAAYQSGVPSIGAESIVGLGHFDYSKTKYVPEEFFAQMKKGHLKSRDILLYKDGGRPGEFEPHITLFGDGFPFDRCSINEHVYRIRAIQGLGQNYLYFWLASDLAMEEMRVKGTGVAIPGLNSTQARSIKTLVPSESVAMEFGRVTEPSIARILRSCTQSQSLQAIRDALLPKLISGELRVKDAERIVGAAS